MATAVLSPGRRTPSYTQERAHPRPLLTGWVTKRKSEGARSRLLCNSNRRFYTVDFNAQVVYYGHTEDSKSVSMPVPFKEILKVEPIRMSEQAGSLTQEPEIPTLQRSDSKGSVGSLGSGLRKRMPSIGALSRKSASEQHGLVLHTTGKAMELFFASKSDAETWIEAFQEAINMSGGSAAREEALRQEGSTAPGSSTGTATPSPRSHADDSAADGPFPLEGDTLEAEMPPGRSARPTSGSGLQAKAASLFACSFGAMSVPSISGGSAWGYASHVEEADQAQAKASRYADKAKGLSLQERLAQLDFSDNEDEDDDDPTAAARKPSARTLAEKATKAKARMQEMVARAAPQQPVIVEPCSAFVQELDSEDD